MERTIVHLVVRRRNHEVEEAASFDACYASPLSKYNGNSVEEALPKALKDEKAANLGHILSEVAARVERRQARVEKMRAPELAEHTLDSLQIEVFEQTKDV